MGMLGLPITKWFKLIYHMILNDPAMAKKIRAAKTPMQNLKLLKSDEAREAALDSDIPIREYDAIVAKAESALIGASMKSNPDEALALLRAWAKDNDAIVKVNGKKI